MTSWERFAITHRSWLPACELRIDRPKPDLAVVSTVFEGKPVYDASAPCNAKDLQIAAMDYVHRVNGAWPGARTKLYKDHDLPKPGTWDYSDPLFIAAAIKLTARGATVDGKPPLWAARELRRLCKEFRGRTWRNGSSPRVIAEDEREAQKLWLVRRRAERLQALLLGPAADDLPLPDDMPWACDEHGADPGYVCRVGGRTVTVHKDGDFWRLTMPGCQQRLTRSGYGQLDRLETTGWSTADMLANRDRARDNLIAGYLQQDDLLTLRRKVVERAYEIDPATMTKPHRGAFPSAEQERVMTEARKQLGG